MKAIWFLIDIIAWMLCVILIINFVVDHLIGWDEANRLSDIDEDAMYW